MQGETVKRTVYVILCYFWSLWSKGKQLILSTIFSHVISLK